MSDQWQVATSNVRATSIEKKREQSRFFYIYLNRVDPLYLVFYTHFWHFVVFFINYLSF